ncbi:retrovirus-related pol polyprotein from transposon TNT 1-94 [Tanacetum coccineum]
MAKLAPNLILDISLELEITLESVGVVWYMSTQEEEKRGKLSLRLALDDDDDGVIGRISLDERRLAAADDNSRPTFDTEPLENVQSDDDYNVFAIEIQHSEQPESINYTYLVEKVDSNVTRDSSDMSTNEQEVDKNVDEPKDERVLLASLVSNLKLDVDENKKIQKQLKKANMSLTQELEKNKRALRDCKFELESFANPKYLKKAQWEKLCLYNVQYDKNDLANLFAPESEETIRLAEEMWFGNDQFAPILGYRDLVQGNVTIKRIYYVEGLNHNLFSVGQFCDADLEVVFRKSTCFVRDLQGNNLLTGARGSNLYTIALQEYSSPTLICFMAKASPTQTWLWHHRLSHLNFDTINMLSKNDIVNSLTKLKTVTSLHMDLCGPMRVEKISRKKFILVIVDDCSAYTLTHFLRSKDETPKVLIDFLKMIQRGLQAQVITVRTDRGTEFLNKTLQTYFKEYGINQQTKIARTPKQNGIVKGFNHTLVEAARTMLSPSKLPLFFWVESITIAFKDDENLDKMKEKGDPCIFVGYVTQLKGYGVYNKRTRLIVESIYINFDKLKEVLTFDHNSLNLAPQRQIASDYDKSADKSNLSLQDFELLFSPMYEEYEGNQGDNYSDQAVDAQFDENEFINPLCTPVHEVAELFSHNIDTSNMCTFCQRHRSDYHWTRDHPLEQVRGNPFKQVQTRRQIATDLELYMFALPVSTDEAKNIKESMVDHAWIEAMQEELHQFDRLSVWEHLDKPFGKTVIGLK